ncbi:hypothetical protein TruAng_001154 [Truncatella angustata]|nr:hypothetical protein TruAng_001154 [Truncatella angustata]
MAGLSDVPTEILNAILEYLFLRDLQTLITSQRTGKRFRAVVQDILTRQRSSSPCIGTSDSELPCAHDPWDRLLWQRFRPLFAATQCFTPEERGRIIYLTIAGDSTLPFKRLPWAQDERSRGPYLRPEASWRGLSVARPGREPITHLEIIRGYQSDDDDTVEYLHVELPGGVLTMGALYDVLLSEQVHFGDETGDWELLLGKRLRDHDLMQEYECFIQEDSDLVDSGPDARQCAILYVQGAITGDVPSDSWPVAHKWTPKIIGKLPRLLSWDESRDVEE